VSTDYDAPRKNEEDLAEDSIEDLKATNRAKTSVGLADVDEPDVDSLELPGADLSGEELTVRVMPRQADEFTCSKCFLVQHQSRLARHSGDEWICGDCA
jgi:hypothetical protein